MESPKTKNPMSKVFKGVNEFNIEHTELLTLVSAKANKNAGINVPKMDVNAMYFH